MPEYKSWRQLAGYFDGDGTIAISDTSNQPYKLGLSLIVVDQSADQIETVRSFLQDRRVGTGNILRTSKGTAYMIAISQFDSVKKTLRCMLPFLCKKAIEAQGALDYYEGKVSGNELAAIFRREVEAGRRERRERKVPIDVPFNYPDGDRAMKERRRIRLRDALGRYRAKVTLADYRSIRREHFVRGKPLHVLTRRYSQYSRETIRRILGRGRGYVLVRAEGALTNKVKESSR